jgi:hypothetical protein
VTRYIRSLQLRLTLELAALFLLASCLAVGGLIYSASVTADSLGDRELGLRADDLASHVAPDAAGSPEPKLSPELKQAYEIAAQQSLFAIREGTAGSLQLPALRPARWLLGYRRPLPSLIFLSSTVLDHQRATIRPLASSSTARLARSPCLLPRQRAVISSPIRSCANSFST